MSAEWTQGRAVFGGLQGALMLHAMRGLVPAELPVRTLQVTFVAPPSGNQLVARASILRQGKSAWLLLPAAVSLALFAWLLSLHPTAAGRVYAAYGGVYIGAAILWLWLVDGIRPTGWDLLGSAVAFAGMAIIIFAPRGA